MSLLQELKRRNVLRVATAYVVAAWLIIQVVETLFPVFGFSDAAIRTVVILLAIGFIPALAISWFFEITPEGLKRDGEVDRLTPAAHSGKWLDRAIVVGLVVVVAYFAVDKFVFDPARDEAREAQVAQEAKSEAVKGFYGDRSIAVLPFVNMSSDPEQEYFAEGISEEILNLLASIRQLRVISRSSAFRFKGRDLDIPDVARSLDVAHILEGSVRKAGNTVRVTAQLIEARTDTHLWSQTYDRELDDIFAIQDEIAADVARNLEITLLQPLPRSRVTDPEVLAFTAQAKHIAQSRPDDIGKKMYALLERALEMDPSYVPALEWMISALWFLEAEGEITPAEYKTRTDSLQVRILELEPNNGNVRSIQAWHVAYDKQDYERAAELFSESVRFDPADSGLVRLAGVFARFLGKFDVSIRLLEHAVAIDPLCFQCLYQLSRSYFYAGKYEQALDMRRRFLQLGTGGQFHYGLMLVLMGEPDEALAYYDKVPDGVGNTTLMAGKAIAFAKLGKFSESDNELNNLKDTNSDGTAALIAEVYAWRGETDLAFEWLNRKLAMSRMGAARLTFNPFMVNLKGDPRLAEWRESLGMSQERLDAIDFNPVLPE